MRFVQARRAAGSSTCSRRISPILMSAFQSARPAYTGSSSSAACPCTAMSSSIPSSIVIAPGWSGSPDSTSAQVLERRLAIVLAIVLDLRHPEADADQIALGQHAALQQILEQARQIAPALGLRVEAIEGLRRASRRCARDLQHALEGGDGLVQPVRAAISARAPICSAQLALGLRVAAGQLRAPDQDLVQRLVVAGARGRSPPAPPARRSSSGTRSSTRRW